jgi:2'-hydroxyisoflavone reductase
VGDVLVIGGSYFAGRVFVEELVKTGAYQAHVLNRGRIPMGMSGVQEIRCDRHDADALRACLAGSLWDAVVDFCAYTPNDVETLLAALPGCAAGHYIFISTASVYERSSRLPVDENTPLLEGPQPELGPMADYGFQKALAEGTLRDICAKRGIPHTIVRPTIIYGKYNYAPRESWFFEQIADGSAVTAPSDSLALFSFVSVWDLARLVISCVRTPAAFGLAINAAGRELVSYGELVRVMEAATGRAFVRNQMSCRELAESGLALPFPIDEHLVYSGALSEERLGFKYTGFMDGMKRTWAYYAAARGIGGLDSSSRTT